MASRAITITARILFFLCGIAALLNSIPYFLLRGSELPRQSEWVLFAAALALLTLFSFAVALLPRSWIANLCRTQRDDPRLFASPLKSLALFAVFFYVIAAIAFSAPHNWNLNFQLMLLLCPMYFLKMTIDPAPPQIFFILALINAGVYGALGIVFGYAALSLRARKAART